MSTSNIGTISMLVGLGEATSFVIQERSLRWLLQENRELRRKTSTSGISDRRTKTFQSIGPSSRIAKIEEFFELMRLRDGNSLVAHPFNKNDDVKGNLEGLQWTITDTRTELEIVRDGDRITVLPSKLSR